MCLLFLSYKTTPGYRLVVAANRDEFLDRPTAPLGYIDDEKKILAGLDLQGGGTWLGVTSQLQFAAITNYRDPHSVLDAAPSRGEILIDYLRGDIAAGRYIDGLVDRGMRYNPFNVILGDDTDLYYYSNMLPKPQRLEPGFYGLSNHLLDSPWPKVVRGKKKLRPHMVDCDTVDTATLFRLLQDCYVPSDDKLPDTGIGLEWERLLSPIFITSENYGTRSSAVITISYDRRVNYVEKSFFRSPPSTLYSRLTEYSLNC